MTMDAERLADGYEMEAQAEREHVQETAAAAVRSELAAETERQHSDYLQAHLAGARTLPGDVAQEVGPLLAGELPTPPPQPRQSLFKLADGSPVPDLLERLGIFLETIGCTSIEHVDVVIQPDGTFTMRGAPPTSDDL